jgi:hypothetical protein
VVQCNAAGTSGVLPENFTNAQNQPSPAMGFVAQSSAVKELWLALRAVRKN